MSFLNPFFFIALVAAAIPVIIHIINFRKPRRVAFSTLAFFQELQKSAIRRLNIKRYLLLALRVLAISMLVLALARPFIPPQVAGWLGASEDGGLIAIMVDNGPSMMQVDEGGPYIDQAKKAARAIIEQSPQGARFLIVPTHGDLESGRFMRRTEALRYLDSMEPKNKGAYPGEHMDFISQQLEEEPEGSGRVYWISDARITQLQKLKAYVDSDDREISDHPVTFIRIGNDSFQNIAVTSVEILDQVPGEGIPVGVSVTVRNFGEQAVYNSYLSLEIDGERIGQYEIDLQGGQEKELLFEVIPESIGNIRGKAILEGGTYTFDHIRYFSIEVPESRNVLLVRDEGEDKTRRSYVKPLLDAAAETGIQVRASYTDINELGEYDLSRFDAVILESPERIPDYVHTVLVRFVQQGRGLLVVPSGKGGLDNYNRFLRQFNAGSFNGMRGTYGGREEVASLQPLAPGHVLVDDIFDVREDEEVSIDLPAIFHYWRYHPPEASPGTTLLKTNLEEPLFVEHTSGDGLIMVGAMGFGPGWSDLGLKPIYAPLLYRMILHVVAWEDGGLREHMLGSPFDRNFTDIGTQVTMTINGVAVQPEIAIGASGAGIRYQAKEWSPGWLNVQFNGREYVLAVNQDILESDFTSLSVVETEEMLRELLTVAGVIDISGYEESEIHSAMASVSFGKEIWRWFILIALAFMVVECIISRTYKTETLSD